LKVYFDGYHGDCSKTVLVGDVDEKGKKLVEASEMCMEAGISVCAPGVPFAKIGASLFLIPLYRRVVLEG
jgi:methionyl aminopeptidase